jgi:hypothetical protein
MSEGVVTKQDEIDGAYVSGVDRPGLDFANEATAVTRYWGGCSTLPSPYRTGRHVMSNQVIERKPNGQFAKGSSGNLGGNAQRSRHALNADTIREMHLAFQRGGRAAINTVMKTQPAAFLKLLVLLVPREMKVEHSGGVKAMTDQQIEQAIEAIQAMLEQQAKVIEGTAETVALPAPEVVPDGLNEVMDAVDTAVGPKERKPRRNAKPVPPPS